MALKKLEKNHKQFLAVVDSSLFLIGTLTDGDIRRGLLRGLKLESSILDCVNSHPVTANELNSSTELDLKFRTTKVNAIPIMSGEKVVDVIFFDDLARTEVIGVKVLIMAGGKGERLLPLTKETPKPLIAINGVPVIDRIVSQFANQGFRNIWISLHHMSDQIRNHLGDGSRFGVQINYIIEDEPLGTAGSLGILPNTESDDILVCNADLFNNVNYQDLYFAHKKSENSATVGITRYETHIPYGVINQENGIFLSLTEKPVQTHLVAAGVNVFNSETVRLLPTGLRMNIPEFYELIIDSGDRIGTFELNGMWIDIGTLETLEQAKKSNRENQ